MAMHWLRVSCALLAALLFAAALKLGLIDLGALGSEAPLSELVPHAFLPVLLFGLPLAAVAIAATEFLRVRSPRAQISVGTALTFLAARAATFNEPINSHVFGGGTLTALAILAIGIAASALYWAIAGRRAGWRGDEAERANQLAEEAYQRASGRPAVAYCRSCLTVVAAAGLLGFAAVSWIMIEATGLRSGLRADVERHGQSVLKSAGFGWATFTIADDQGVILGPAPDELQKRAAYDAVREALGSVTGFPGVVTRVVDKAVARTPVADTSRKLAEVALREAEARRAVEDAQRAAAQAREAEQEARLIAAEARAAGEQSKRRAQEQLAALPAPPPEAVTPPAEPREGSVAAVAPTPDAVGARPSSAAADGSACTDQDLALVETSRIIFEPQTFAIDAGFQGDLDRIASSIRACAHRPIQVMGHADTSSDRLFNPALGLQRAEAVRDGLIARGVAPTRVVTSTMPFSLAGDTEPSSDARAASRRSDFKFLEASALSRDATQRPDERAANCESDLTAIMAQSIIHFPTNSSRVSPESMGLVAKLAQAIQTCGSVIVTVEGHTDRVGTADANQKLSEARANAVRETLLAVGADSTRLASRGFASSRPYRPGESAEAYALNRRIEFRVSGKFTTTNAGGP